MVEIHGWITPRLSFTTAEDSFELDMLEKQILEQIQKKMEPLAITLSLVSFHYMNGEPGITIAHKCNHFSEECQDVISFYEEVAQVAKGSYGLLYIHDDENEKGLENEFQVYVLRKGKLEKEKDHYLSPCQPVIEEHE